MVIIPTFLKTTDFVCVFVYECVPIHNRNTSLLRLNVCLDRNHFDSSKVANRPYKHLVILYYVQENTVLLRNFIRTFYTLK